MTKKPFYFDGNQWSGFVDSQARWNELLAAHRWLSSVNGESTTSASEARVYVLKARRGPQEGRDCFGTYGEYRGEQTLWNWLESLSPDERVMEVI
jgi:hypothetical protein